jgi:hypothetical protein
MNLTTETLPLYFLSPSAKDSHYSVPTNCFDFVSNSSHHLLVTLGDSWTWGQALDNRLTEVYGRWVSQYFGWDWLNLGQPGSSNFVIAERAEELAKIIPDLDYTEITVICVFTEVGRGFNSHHDSHIDYNAWMQANLTQASDFDLFLEMINRNCADRIVKALSNHANVYFGSNFVHPLGLPNKQTFPHTWVEVLGLRSDSKVYAGTTGTTKLQQVQQFVPQHQTELFKTWFANTVDRSQLADQITHSFGPGRIHPTAQQQKIWANYVSNYLENK